ncbi:MAG: hypothetical protein ACTSQE_10880 [Candidatus Heimdallarchaeaceae archaeon]
MSKVEIAEYLASLQKIAQAGAESSSEKQERIGDLLNLIFSEDVHAEAITPHLIEIALSYGDPKKLTARTEPFRNQAKQSLMSLASILSDLSIELEKLIEFKNLTQNIPSTIELKVGKKGAIKLELDEENPVHIQTIKDQYRSIKKEWILAALQYLELCGVSTKPNVSLAEILEKTAPATMEMI